jgi:hypothetical protein
MKTRFDTGKHMYISKVYSSVEGSNFNKDVCASEIWPPTNSFPNWEKWFSIRE